MFVIDRDRGTDAKGVPQERIELAGSTGNIYTITIGQLPKCTCPDKRFNGGSQCKHLIYVLHQVLKAPPHLEYQNAFISSELNEIFEHAPLPSAGVVGDVDSETKEEEDSEGVKRKSMEGCDCPICFMPFEPNAKEEIVWCRAACGNNVHRRCFEQWAKSQAGREVRCVYW